ncbi:MAG TPA: MltA domain-containing protein [Burkholderiaceae bacterium]|nr:MltA domain-containing protein [Burkholderiaceae bacterium]
MLVALSATGCGVQAQARIEPVDSGRRGAMPVDQLPGWQRDGLDGLGDALRRQCALRTPPAPWPALCKELPPISADAAKLRNWIETRFVARPLTGADGRAAGLITGYHEPLLTGSRRRESPSQVPLYRRPADLAASGDARHRVVNGRRTAYPTRAEIEGGGLLDGSELVWLDEPVEAFFLQVQGSGRVRLRDGSTLRVGFADHNGHRYRAIGAVLVERGEIPRGEVDAPRIKAWLRSNPERAREVMHSNPRYIFFRELPASADADAGPPGSLGVPLTPMRSVATDPAFVPPGALLYLETRYPDDGRLLARAMLSQDRGAAILGGVRADIFFGAGDEAERLAGLMQEPGRIWQLVPRLSAPSTRPASG